MNPEAGEIHIGDRRIPFTVSRSRKRRRTIGFVMKDPSVLTISAPMRASLSSIHSIMQKNTRWILRRLAEFQRVETFVSPTYAEGEYITYLGRRFKLRVTHDDNKPQGCTLAPHRMIVNLRNKEKKSIKQSGGIPRPLAGGARGGLSQQMQSIGTSPHLTCPGLGFSPSPASGGGTTALNEEVRLEILLWIKRRAKIKFQKRMDYWAHRLGVRYQKLVIANPEQRWGSCSAQNVIRLNWRLIMAPLDILDYVVVHELCHVRHKNHGPRFWAQVATEFPDWKIKRKHLHSIGRSLVI